MDTIKLINTDSDFLEKAGTKIDNEWLNIPFWFRKIGEGVYEQYDFDELPGYLKTRINKLNDTA